MVKSIISALLLLLCVGSVVNAEQISLKNGDRLTGSIVSLDGKKLVLKTIYAGEVSIDWDSVEQFTSDQPLVLSTVDKKTVTGTVRSEGPDYVVTTTQGAQTMAKSDIAVIRSLADQAAYDKSLHPGILGGWSGGGNFGLAFARGNSETSNLALGFDAKRKTEKEAWILNATSIYSTDAHLSTTTANSFQGLIRYDHNLSKRVFAYRSVRWRLR